MFEKRSEPQFLTRSYYCRFCDRKKKCTIHMSMKTGAIYCVCSYLSGSLRTNKSFWLGWKFSKLRNTSNCNKNWMHTHLAPCVHFQTQNSVPPNSSHFAINPLNPGPVTSKHNSEILSRYLSGDSVELQRSPTSTTTLPQYLTSPCPISSNTSFLPGEDGSIGVSSLLSVGSAGHL